MSHYKSIFISDIHLGTRGCQADSLCSFLKENTADNLFLVGDILDGWRLKKRWYFPQSHANVIRRILTSAKRGTNVYYILGNHDEGFRKYLNFNIDIGRIQVSNRLDYIGVNGKKYLVVHGDMFDQIMITKKWLMHIGDTLYQILIWTNTKFNKIRGLLGMQYWSLSKWLKHHTKQALNYVYKFEENVAQYCRRKGYDGIICGHIHTAGIRDIDGIEYMNDGDWVESCSALVEHNDGKWEIIYYTQYK
jgi:UDP-2,3-diacylglucosamine pyrophosphatase LpxH|tara:strand:- start:103 stop:846 length:744 start_codon:yes stop_codon:yes gene_type:complete